jgi:hypothetical protein
VALAISACSASDVRDRLDSATEPLQAPRSTPPVPSNPDQPRVDTSVSAIAGLRAALAPVATSAPALADLVALHAAHLKRLAGHAGTGLKVPAVVLDQADLTASVRAHEAALATTLADQAGSAHDGALALLLGSMSAAVSQRVAVLG